MSASNKLAGLLRPMAEAVLEDGEELRGICAASEINFLSGHTRGVITTDRRVLIQGVDRNWQPKGEPFVILPGDVEDVKVTGLGDDWYDTAISLVDHAGYTVKLRLTGGKKIKLMAMSGEGKILGALGGGDTQASGANALLVWLSGLRQFS